MLAKAGSSADGVDLAARHADLVFTPQATPEAARAFRTRLHAEMSARGRAPDEVRTLPGLWSVSGFHASGGRRLRRGVRCGVEPCVPVRRPHPHRRRRPGPHRRHRSRRSVPVRRVRAGLPGGLHPTGPLEALADLVETWWRTGAADGFTLQPLRLPYDLELFVDHVVPILRARGVAQREPGAGTRRDRLGVARPPGRRS